MLRYLRLGLLGLVALAIALALIVSLVPFVDTKWWLVRLLDFPRLQFGIVTLLLLVPLPFFSRAHPRIVLVLAGAALAALGGDGYKLWPYRSFSEASLADASCPADRGLVVMISNVLLSNRQSQTLLDEVQAQKPDIFLAMEIDEWWDRTLQPLAADMPYGATKITGSYYGMRLFSRLPLVDTDVRFLAGRDTPSIVTGVKLRDGETATFLGIHPRPPLVGQSALPRDAELYAAAKILREKEGPAIMAGDLNATPWEDAVRRTRRIAGLVSPRQGYGYTCTASTPTPGGPSGRSTRSTTSRASPPCRWNGSPPSAPTTTPISSTCAVTRVPTRPRPPNARTTARASTRRTAPPGLPHRDAHRRTPMARHRSDPHGTRSAPTASRSSLRAWRSGLRWRFSPPSPCWSG